MQDVKKNYDPADLEIILLLSSDIVTASVPELGDNHTAPGNGDWDNNGWIKW